MAKDLARPILLSTGSASQPPGGSTQRERPMNRQVELDYANSRIAEQHRLAESERIARLTRPENRRSSMRQRLLRLNPTCPASAA